MNDSENQCVSSVLQALFNSIHFVKYLLLSEFKPENYREEQKFCDQIQGLCLGYFQDDITDPESSLTFPKNLSVKFVAEFIRNNM